MAPPRKRVRRAPRAREAAVEAPVDAGDVEAERGESYDLRVLAKVFALRFVRSIEQSQDKVAFLVGAGFSQAEVADMLLMNPTTVRTNLFNARKK